MTEILRVFAGLDVKAVQISYEVVRVTFASPEHFRAAKSFLGKPLSGLWCSILGGGGGGPPFPCLRVFDFLFEGGGGGGGGPPLTCMHVFEVPFEEDDRSLEVAFEAYGAVTSVKKQTFLSN